ncbi:MAG: ATP-binding protein, partial [Cytophagales bacterium]|nr:ATP-binding protein [Cytophagales bacterium]
ALGYVFESLLGMKRNTGIAIGGLTVVAYSALGGIKSVVITDVIQFGVLIVMIPLIANVATNNEGGVSALLHKVPAEKWIVFKHEKFTEYLAIFFIGSIFPAVSSSPPFMQRMLMARNKQQIANMFYMGVAFEPPFRLVVMLIGLAAVVSYPKISANEALPHIVHKLLPMGIKGLAVVGLLAVIMSTADSFLNSAGLLVTHDVIKPMCDKRKIAVNEVTMTKYITFFIGIIALFFAAISENIIKLIFYGLGLIVSFITIPLLAGILGLKTDAKSFFIALFVALGAVIVASLYFPSLQYLVSPIGIVVNGIAFFGAHFIQNDGFKVVKWEEEEQEPSKVDWVALRRRMAKAIHPNNLIQRARQKITQYGVNPVLFAVFCSLNYVVPLFMWTHENPPHYATLFVIRLIGGGLCVGLLTKDYWPARLKAYFPVYWYFTLFYCLPVTTTLMFIAMGGTTEWFINIGFAITLLILLVDWLSFILLSVVGVGVGILLHYLLVTQGVLTAVSITGFSTIYLLIYTCVFATLIGLLFARRKEEAIEEEKRTNQLYAANIAHDLDNTIGCVRLFSSGLDSMLKTAPIKVQVNKKGEKNFILPQTVYEFIEDLPRQLSQESARGYEVIKVMLEAVKRGGMIDPRQLEETSLQGCVVNAILRYHMEDEQRKNITFKKGQDFTVLVEKKALWHVFYNLLKNAHRYAGSDCQLTLWIDGKNRRFHLKDDGEGIPRNKLSKIFEPFYTGSRVGSGIGLGMCKKIMEGLGGRIYCRSKQGEGSYAE